MNIISSAFENNTPMPSAYSCDGAGVNPPLMFSGVPAGALSLLLIVDDPDAPMGTFTHWILYNIEPSVAAIEENSIPNGAKQGKNSTGRTNFVGACPPSGEHRYFFKLYALDTTLDMQTPDKQTIETFIKNHILAEAQLVGLYKRK